MSELLQYSGIDTTPSAKVPPRLEAEKAKKQDITIEEAQRNAANFSSYLALRGVFNDLSHQYATNKAQYHSYGEKVNVPEVQAVAQRGLEDIYFGKYKHNSPEVIREWGEEGVNYQSVVRQNREKIDAVVHKAQHEASSLSTADRLSISLKGLRKIPFLKKEDRMRALGQIGYSESEIKDMNAVLGFALGANTLAYIVEDRVPDIFAIPAGYELSKHIDNPLVTYPLAAVAAAYYYKQYLNKINQTIDMLEEGSIVTSNVMAAIAYFSSSKMLAANETVEFLGKSRNARRLVTATGFVINPSEIVKEATWKPLLFAQPAGPLIHGVGDVIGGGILQGEQWLLPRVDAKVKQIRSFFNPSVNK